MYDPGAEGGANDLGALEPGRGYWLRTGVGQAGTWTVTYEGRRREGGREICAGGSPRRPGAAAGPGAMAAAPPALPASLWGRVTLPTAPAPEGWTVGARVAGVMAGRG